MTAPSRPRRPGSPPGVVPAVPRLAARARAERVDRRRRRVRRVLRAFAVLLPLTGLAWVVLLSPWLAVDRVVVTGTSRLTPEQVVEVAGDLRGTPLARLDAGAVSDRVGSLGPVHDVVVRRSWPSTLRLEVTERQPAVGVVGAGAVRLADAAGVVFAEEPVLPAGVPSLEVSRPGPDDPETQSALAVLSELPDALRAQVTVVRASTAAGVELVLGDGRTIRWGEPGDSATKTAALATLLGMPGTIFDVSAPGVAVRR